MSRHHSENQAPGILTRTAKIGKGPGLQEGQEEKKEEVSEPIDEKVEPHVYEVACHAYRGLLEDNEDQTILVTGESGSGKSETVNILQEYLVAMETLQPVNACTQVNSDVATKVLQSSLALEPFGNAQTRRNNNSSRFGKLIQLHFCIDSHDNDGNLALPTASLIGAVCYFSISDPTLNAIWGRARVSEMTEVFVPSLLDLVEGQKREHLPTK